MTPVWTSPFGHGEPLTIKGLPKKNPGGIAAESSRRNARGGDMTSDRTCPVKLLSLLGRIDGKSVQPARSPKASVMWAPSTRAARSPFRLLPWDLFTGKRPDASFWWGEGLRMPPRFRWEWEQSYGSSCILRVRFVSEDPGVHTELCVVHVHVPRRFHARPLTPQWQTAAPSTPLPKLPSLWLEPKTERAQPPVPAVSLAPEISGRRVFGRFVDGLVDRGSSCGSAVTYQLPRHDSAFPDFQGRAG